MRKLRTLRGGKGGAESVGVFAFEVAALMSRAAHLWRALGDAQVARLRDEMLRLEGVRRLVADDDDVLLSLALAEMADECGALSRSVARLSCRCTDPLLRRFDGLFAGFIKDGADPHGLRYAAADKMERKARKMDRLVGATASLYQEFEVLGELEQGLRRARGAAAGEVACRLMRQRHEVERLRAASLWNRSIDYAVRLLARSLFTIVARIRLVFGLEPKNARRDDDAKVTITCTPLSWRNSFVGVMQSMIYPSAFATDAARRWLSAKSGLVGNGDVRRFLLSRTQSLRIKWPVASRQLTGCTVGGNESPVMDRWIHVDDTLSPSFSAEADHNAYSSVNFRESDMNAKFTMSVFGSSQNAPASTLGAAALALHYANLIVFIEKLAVSPFISLDERDGLYNMLTASLRESLKARLKSYAKNLSTSVYHPSRAAEWADSTQRILGWLAPLAHNMIQWQTERNVEQRNAVSSTSVLLLQTLHFADQEKTEAAMTELLVGLNSLWRSGRGLNAQGQIRVCR